MRIWVAAVLMVISGTAKAAPPLPVLDVHMHALAADEQGPPPMGMCTPFVEFPAWDQRHPYSEAFMARLKHPKCPNPVWSPKTDVEVMSQSIAAMRRRNIYGVLSGTAARVATWREAAPGRFIPGLSFGISDHISIGDLERLHAAGALDVIGEITTQYEGIEPTDPRLEPYWALAERLDIPVAIHVGPGPFGVIYMGASGYRARMHSALSMEEVLVRHPHLRVDIMHAGYPMVDDLLALLYAHPQVHVDTGVIVFTQPRAAFYRFLQRIVEAGFANRVMFGSDQMVWPVVIERSVKVIEDAPFLTARQKRDILYNNAARFLRLTPQERARQAKGL